MSFSRWTSTSSATSASCSSTTDRGLGDWSCQVGQGRRAPRRHRSPGILLLVSSTAACQLQSMASSWEAWLLLASACFRLRLAELGRGASSFSGFRLSQRSGLCLCHCSGWALGVRNLGSRASEFGVPAPASTASVQISGSSQRAAPKVVTTMPWSFKLFFGPRLTS